jgi:hypothetical protein
MKTSFKLLLPLLVIGLAACSKKAQQAADYNDAIVNQQLNIVHAFDLLDSTLKDTLAAKQQADYAYVNLDAQVKRSILALDSIGSFNKDPQLQSAARELFRAYEDVTLVQYHQLLELKYLPAEAITIAIADSSNALQKHIHDKTQTAQERFLKAQEDFGTKYNLSFQ